MHFQTSLPTLKLEIPFGDELIGMTSGAIGMTQLPVGRPLGSKKAKHDYSSENCSICFAKADGLHYGAISCRSCNAFFRRAVTFKQKFACRKGGNCDLKSVRCACRACRFGKCLQAGMSPEAVQPKRDPTGTQKNRRPPKRRKWSTSQLLENSEQFSPSLLPSVGSVVDSMTNISCDTSPNCELNSVSPYITLNTSLSPYISVCSPSPPLPQSVEEPNQGYEISFPTSIRLEAPTKTSSDRYMDDADEFEGLVRSYHEHLNMMNRAMMSIDDFLDEQEKGPLMRMMKPTDVERLSTTELNGFMFWIEKLNPFKNLEAKDREVFFKMYSVRKLSLDHFYTASKYPELIKKGCFAMLNNTFVPPDRTGFETLMDDERTKKAKRDILRPTIDRLWHTVVLPFMHMNITDAEIVTLHILLLWSSNNNRHVNEQTKQLMKKRREWAVDRLYEHYEQVGTTDPMVRLGEVLLLLPEIELVCDQHCKDFQVAQLFDFCNMSELCVISPVHGHQSSESSVASGVNSREQDFLGSVRGGNWLFLVQSSTPASSPVPELKCRGGLQLFSPAPQAPASIGSTESHSLSIPVISPVLIKYVPYCTHDAISLGSGGSRGSSNGRDGSRDDVDSRHDNSESRADSRADSDGGKKSGRGGWLKTTASSIGGRWPAGEYLMVSPAWLMENAGAVGWGIIAAMGALGSSALICGACCIGWYSKLRGQLNMNEHQNRQR
uniref:Uncharacterized protein n=1 Tax=Ditylenchus dipsaci TaxID=166011 RepID=A0A915EE95_9BILA